MMEELSLIKQALRAVMNGQPLALRDPHRPTWHLAPSVGLLNDPNGFIQHNGVYHLFYQWNPLGCDHRNKCWGHWQSIDLVHWEHQPLALAPGACYDSHGCYSGSAVVAEDKVTLIYTGNVKFPDGSRTAYQCLAQASDRGEYRKLGPVLPLPEGYSGHVRDPKVWRHQDAWYMVLGARDLQDRGKVLLLRSSNLRDWQALGEIAGSGLNDLGEFGYMWECPDLFSLDGGDVLICCPQGWRHSRNATSTVIRPAICSASWIIGRRPSATANFTSWTPASSSTRPRRRRPKMAAACCSPGWACPSKMKKPIRRAVMAGSTP